MRNGVSTIRLGVWTGCVLAALLPVALPGPVAADESVPVLGQRGDVYKVAAGTYGELFAEGAEAPADTEVLRVEVRRGLGEVERHLVPGSEDNAADRTPSLSFDAATGKLYVVWSSSDESILTRINLASFDGSQWGETIEVSGHIFSEKSSPRVAVTHDRFELASAEEGESSTRTILHVVWSEGTAAGDRTMYAPVVLVDGELASPWRRVHRLNDYVAEVATEAPRGLELAPPLARAPTVDVASESNSVIIGFVDRTSGTLVQMEAAAPAVELAEIGASLADYLDSSRLCQRIRRGEPDVVGRVAQGARVHIVVVGRRIRGTVRSSLAQSVGDVLVDRADELCSEGGLGHVASAARVHIVVVGARFQDGELLEQTATVSADARVLLAAAQPMDDGGYLQHLARLQIKSVRPAPVIGDGRPRIFVSPEGSGAVVAWEGESSVSWVETDQETGHWSKTFSLHVGETLSRSEAWSALRARARSLNPGLLMPAPGIDAPSIE